MKSITAVFVMFFLLVVLVTAPAAQILANDVIRPVHQKGDTWVYRVAQSDWITSSTTRPQSGDYQVIFHGGKLEISQATGPVDSAKTEIFKDLLGIEDPTIEAPLLKFPFAPGKSWLARFKPSEGTGMTNANHKVLPSIKMKTQAGTFLAYPIERESFSSRISTSSTYFYSPETRSIILYSRDSSSTTHKSVTGRTNIELIGFTRSPAF